MTPPTTVGLLLAAGAGRRMGTPKALLRDGGGTPQLARAIGVLLDGGCDVVTVVLGARAEEAATLLADTGWTGDPAVRVVHAEHWDEGMGASLRTGLRASLESPADGAADRAVVLLVDLPDVDAAVVRRLLAAGPDGPDALARASYDGKPGHPVVLGRAHWAAIAEGARGDSGARDYLRSHPPVLVECADLATGRDTDTPADLLS